MKSLEAEKPRDSKQKKRQEETHGEGWKVRKRRRGRERETERERERIIDPETEEGIDRHKERKRQTQPRRTHVDVGRETKVSRNNGPGPTWRFLQVRVWETVASWLAPQNICGHCCPELITLQGRELWAKLPQSQGTTPG